MDDNVSKRGLSRRQFLKTTAVTAAVAAVGGKLLGGPISSLVERADAAPVKEDKWIPSACWMCREGCGILAHRVDGVIVKVEGNPEVPLNQGRLCARGNAAMFKLYNPYRVKTPVKRTNPDKGPGVDPKWQEISWDEAYNIVADRMKKIKADNPNKFTYQYGWGGGYSSGVAAFHRAFGSANGQSGYGGILCGAGMHTASYQMLGVSSDSSDDQRSLFMIRSSAQGVNKAGVGATREFTEARERGMKFIVVDPRYSNEAMKADEWVPIRPGTDRIMMLSMINILLNELNVYDVECVKKGTNGPYLIGPDGLYVRSKTDLVDSPVRKEKLGKPYIWDPKDNIAKLFDDPSIKDYALEGTFDVEGVKAQPAFQMLKNHVKQYTPEMAESVTTVPATTIRRLTKMLSEEARIGQTITINGTVFPYRPIGTRWRGARLAQHGSWDAMTAFIMWTILGANGVPGGFGGGDATAVSPDPSDGVIAPKGTAAYHWQWPPDANMNNGWYPIAYKTVPTAFQAVLDPKKYGCPYETEMVFNHGANTLMGGGSVKDMIAAWQKIPFSASLGYHFDEQVEMADVVFPDPGYTGWLRLSKGGDYIHQPLLEKDLYDTRLPEDVYTELAARVGFLDKWNDALNSGLKLNDKNKLDLTKKYSWEEIFDRSLKSTYGDEFGADWFKQHGVKQIETDPRAQYAYFKYPWGKTRYPIYIEYQLWAGLRHKKDMAKVGQDLEKLQPGAYKDFVPLPTWEEAEAAKAPAEWDMWAFNWKGPLMTMGQTMDNPWLREYMDLYDEYTMLAWINADTAAKKNLKDGDQVWVESYVSGLKVKAELKTSQAIHPEGVAIGGEFGQWSPDYSPIGRDKGPHYNTLLSYDPKFMDPLSGGFNSQTKVKIYKA
jgi:anaerobic selenocysteine-containing dehydrogenase